MRLQRVVSDFDEKEMVEHFHISIERPNFTIEYPKSFYTNRLEVDLLENQIMPFMQRLTYHRIDIMPGPLPKKE